MVARGPAGGLEVSGKALDVASARTEQQDVVFCAPGDELTQVEGVGLAGQAGVARQESGQGKALGAGEERVVALDRVRDDFGLHVEASSHPS